MLSFQLPRDTHWHYRIDISRGDRRCGWGGGVPGPRRHARLLARPQAAPRHRQRRIAHPHPAFHHRRRLRTLTRQVRRTKFHSNSCHLGTVDYISPHFWCLMNTRMLWKKCWKLPVGRQALLSRGSTSRVAKAQGKEGIWFLLFPDRENTGNFALTQGKILRHRENIFLWHREKFRQRENIWLWLLK